MLASGYLCVKIREKERTGKRDCTFRGYGQIKKPHNKNLSVPQYYCCWNRTVVLYFLRRDTYLHAILGIQGAVWSTGAVIGGYLGDFLWSYALFFAVYWIWQDSGKRVTIALLTTIALGSVLELLQKIGIISGTFDIWDIFTEAVAALTAAIIITIKRSTRK